MLWMVLALGLTGCTQDNGLTSLVGGEGYLRFNLQFDNEEEVDLDLHVLMPNDTEVFWGNTSEPTGGALDVDCRCTTCPLGGNENIVWGYDGTRPDVGLYTVAVNYYEACWTDEFEPTSEYTLRILVSGVVYASETGVLGEFESTAVDFVYGG